MRSFHKIACLALILIVFLVAGCTQPGTDNQKTVSPPPTMTGSSTGGISPQATLSLTPQPTSPMVTVTDVQNRGTSDPAFIVDISVPEKIWPGTTILADNHDEAHPRIIEVNRLGEIVWEYALPDELKSYTNPGWDVEVLQNGNILTVLPRKGVYEINRDKQVVWKYLDSQISHDADRLSNGNTLFVFGASDKIGDAQVKEIDPAGNRVWSWYARDVFTGPEYAGISEEGWTHTNAVSRLDSGNTLISLRNFNVIAEVNPAGKLVKTIGKGLFTAQHDPLVLSNGNILLANHGIPNEAIELDPSGIIVWNYTIQKRQSWPVRDVNRHPNGNTLITECDRIIEVTRDGQVVWQFRLLTPFTDRASTASRGFYKAERISL